MKSSGSRMIFLMAAMFCSLGGRGLPQSQESRKEAGAPQSLRRVEIRDTEMRFLTSKHVDQTYEIDIFFPQDYRRERGRYPVLYVLDAEYNFGCVSYIVRRLIKNGDIPKILVVGIAYNTTEEDFYARRERDATPPSKIHGLHSGGVENFVRFFENELIPFIDENYRTTPGDRTIVGVSKLARVVEAYARRPQVQERMTTEIADTIYNGLKASGVGVVIQAEHMCMIMRGIKKAGSNVITSALRGNFRSKSASRAEFFSLIQGK